MNRTPLGLILALVICCLVTFCLAGTLPMLAGAAEDDSPASQPTRPGNALQERFVSDVRPFITKHCTFCHNVEKETVDLDLSALRDMAAVSAKLDVLELMRDRLTAGEMPPEERPRPEKLEIDTVVAWIEAILKDDAAVVKSDPGRVTIRRLNRAEYKNTIRDLLGVDFEPAETFPADDVGYGFDNIGDVLSLSPVLMEKYLAAAEEIAAKAIVAEPGVKVTVRRLEAEKFKPDRETGGGRPGREALVFFTEGSSYTSYEFPFTGEYVFRLRAFAYQAGPDPARMVFRLGGDEIQTFDVNATRDAPQVYEVRISVEAGRQRLRVDFINDYYKPDDPDPENRDRNLAVDYLEIDGPYGAEPPPLPETHAGIFTCQPEGEEDQDDCARKILARLAKRAFRRGASEEEIERLVQLARLVRSQGDTFERGVQIALQAMLVSPHFLFRIEHDADANDPQAVHTVSQYELATRLSYFLWSSMPDEELFRIAEEERLHEPDVLRAQVMRMLADPKSQALVENFAGQWLQLRNLETAAPDPQRFPAFDDALRSAMRRETELFFETVMREDRSIMDFIDAKFTFVNEPLAKHYGLEGIEGDEFQRVDLDGHQRSGVLTHASIMTVTSNPTRTSPVKRGKWVLENFLGAPPSPPPDGVEELAEDEDAVLSGSLRERMEQHRANASCAVCHVEMDALGFGLENYDAIGAWRTRDGEFEVDASGTLPGNRTFESPEELKVILAEKRDAFCRCLAEKLLTYALGRGLERYDRPAVEAICAAAAENGYRFSELAVKIVESDPFTMRRGDGGKP